MVTNSLHPPALLPEADKQAGTVMFSILRKAYLKRQLCLLFFYVYLRFFERFSKMLCIVYV